jgi:hypothetical protein
LKLAGGEETPRFEAKVVNAKGGIVAFVSNGGTGGCCSWTFASPEEQKAFYAFIDTQTDLGNFEVTDAWVYKQMDRLAEIKTFKRALKTKWVFRVDGDAEGYYRTMSKAGRTEGAFVLYLERQYNGKADILNEKTFEWERVNGQSSRNALPAAPSRKGS